MNPKKEDVINIARKFMWLDSHRIKLINNEGIEKIVDINNKFEESGFGMVPMINREL